MKPGDSLARAYGWILTPALIMGGIAVSVGMWWLATAEVRERRRSWRAFLALEENGFDGAKDLFERWASIGPDPDGKYSPLALLHLDADTDQEAIIAVWQDFPKLAGTIDYPHPHLQLVVLNGLGEQVGRAAWSQFAPGHPVFSKIRPDEVGAWCLQVRGTDRTGTCTFIVRKGRLLPIRGLGPPAALNEFLERNRWAEFLQRKEIGETLAFLKWLGWDGRFKTLDAQEREQLARLAVSSNPWVRAVAESLHRP